MSKIALLVACAFLPCLARAESSPTAPTAAGSTTVADHSLVPDPEKELATMTERLKLTPLQQNEIKPILVAEAEKRKEIFNDTKLTPQQKHQLVGAIHRVALEKIKTVFTPEQITLIEQGMSHPAPGAAHPDPTAK